MNSRALKIAGIVVGGLLGLVLLFLLIAPSFIDKVAILEKLNTKVEALTGRQLIHGDASVSIISGAKVEIMGIALRNHPDASANYFFRADKLIIHFDLFDAMFGDSPHAEQIELVSPRLDLERLKSGKNNWSFLQTNKGKIGANDHISLKVTKGSVAFTHHGKDFVEDIKGIDGIVSYGQNQLTSDLLAIHRGVNYKLSGICSFAEKVEHIGHLDSDCSALFTSGLFKIDYKGRVILADNAFRHKGTLDIDVRDVRHMISLLERNELSDIERAKLSMPFRMKIESYSDTKQWIVNANSFALGESTGKGSMVYDLASTIGTANLNLWFDKVDADQLLGTKDRRGLLAHDLFATSGDNEAHNNLMIDFTIRGKQLKFRNAQLSNMSIMGQVMAGEVILSDARAVMPGGGSLIVLGHMVPDKDGVEFTGQVEAHGHKFYRIMPMLEIDDKRIPKDIFGMYRTRFNIIIRPESTTVSELRLLLQNKIQVAGGINLFYKKDRKKQVDATISMRYINLDPFMESWRSGFNLMVDPEKTTDHPFWFRWLKNYDGIVSVGVELEDFTFLGQKGKKSNVTVNIVDQKLQLSGINMRLGRSSVKGKLSLAHQENKERPKIEGQLNISYLNLKDQFRQTMELQEGEESFDGTIWSRRPINLYPLHYFDTYVELRVRKIDHEYFEMLGLRTKVNLEDYKLHFEDIQAQVWGGDFKGDLTVDSEVVPGISLSYSLSNAQMRMGLESFVDFKNIAGVMSLSGKLNFSGVSFMDWIKGMNGHVAIDARNLLVRYFNLPAIVRAINSVRAVSGLMNSMRLALDEGATRIGNLNGTAYFQDGQVKTTRISFRSNESVGEVAGTFDLSTWMMKVAVKFGLTSLAQKNYPVLVLNFDGPLNMPERSINTKSVEAYLARKIR